MKKLIVVLGLLLAVTQVNAAGGMDAKQIYFGGGLSSNDYNNLDATGFQVFAGMPLPVKMGSGTLAAEVGYMDSGDFDGGGTNATGLWGTAVATMPLQDSLHLIGRLGLDIGDDDGIMFGVGLGFKAADKMDVRFEYVVRDLIDSLQVNLVIRQ